MDVGSFRVNFDAEEPMFALSQMWRGDMSGDETRTRRCEKEESGVNRTTSTSNNNHTYPSLLSLQTATHSRSYAGMDTPIAGDRINEERAFIKRYTEGLSGSKVEYPADFSTPLEDRPRKVAVIGVC